MRKILFSAAALLAFGFANAQDAEMSEGFAKGDVFLSGSFNFGSSKYTSSGNFKESTFTFNPRAGFFISEDIAIGLSLGYGSSKVEETEGADETKVDAISVGAFGRYYWTPASKFSVFGQLGLEYASVDYDLFKVNGFGIELAPGVSYFLNDHFAIEASWGALRYSTAKADVDGAENSTDLNVGFNLDDINFGLVYKF